MASNCHKLIDYKSKIFWWFFFITEAHTFFIPVISNTESDSFSIPNFFDTKSDSFHTKFFWYRIWYLFRYQIWYYFRYQFFLYCHWIWYFLRYQIFWIQNPILFRHQVFVPNPILFQYKIFSILNFMPLKNGKSWLICAPL